MNHHPSFVFFGTPDVASNTLEILINHGLIPELVVTAPDRPAGRHFTLTPPAVKSWIENYTQKTGVSIPLLQPEKITSEFIASLPRTDFFIVVAYGKILPETLINTPRIATLNIHYSLLPRFRGASPVEAAILHGDTETGVSIQKMVFKLDAGPVLAEERLPIDINDTTASLRAKLIPIGANKLAEMLTTWEPERYNNGIIQDEALATHCGKIKKEDALVSLNDDPQVLWNKYRAYHGWPCIYFLDSEGKRVKITTATFTAGKFVPITVIPEGKKEMPWVHYQNS